MSLLTSLLAPGNGTSDTIVYEAHGGPGQTGTPNVTNLATSNPAYRVAGWHFDAAGYEAAYFLVPAYRLGGWSTLDVTILAGNSGTGTGDVLWRASYGWVTPTTTLAVAESVGSQITWTATDRDVLANVTLLSGLAVQAGKDLRLQVNRRGGEVEDTLANDAAVVRVVLGKAS